MSTRVFVYGMLMFPQLCEALTGRIFQTTPALLPDYHRYRLKSEQYPAIAQHPGATTQGVLLKDVDPASLAIFDYFEDVDEGVFCKQQVNVQTTDGHHDQALAYVAGPALQSELTGSWQPDQFDPYALQNYIETIVTPCLNEYLAELNESFK